MFQGVDSVAAGGKGFGAVGAASGDKDADFPNLQAPNAVVDGKAADIRPLVANPSGNLAENFECHRLVGLIF
jgi:hypothetical protein